MFKKTKSSLAITLSVAMLATMVTIPQVASAATGTQISGKDRYETALKIVQDGWDKSESAVIARGDDLADALSAAPLAYAKGKAPILLTKTNEIPAGVLQELKDLGVKNVYIVGGVGAVSKTVADQLAGQGLTITRVQGDDRYETSLAVAKEAFAAAPADVVIANGLAYADALSVSSIAASKGMPILLVDHNKLSAEQATYIAGKSVYAVGGEGVLNADVVSVTKATRLAGADRYSTNAAVLAKFEFDYTKLYLAKGTPANLVDSLAGSALASKTNSPIVLVDGSNKLDTKLATVVTDKIKDDTAIVRLGGTVAQSTADAVEALKSAVNVGEVKVETVSAINAKEFKVVFNKAVTDVTKVVFAAKRGTTPIVLVPTWNAANTEAILTYTANLPEDSYSVNVMNGTTDLGTSTVAITKQKVAKINIIGDTIGVAPVTMSDDATPVMEKQQGFISYDVRDQYGVNITDLSLAKSIDWSSSIGDAVADKGLITITSYSNAVLLTQYTTAVLTAINPDSNVSTSATLKVSLSQGTLSDMKLNTLTNVDNKVLTDMDTFNKFYLDYTALDISGNATKNGVLLGKGLLDSDDNVEGLQIYSSNPTLVTATVVEDPTNSTNAVIEVKAVGTTPIYADTTIILTAMTKTGKSSSITLTLKKAAALDKLNISLPSQEIAIGDTNVEIPYEAFDQDGNKMTSYTKIVGSGNVTSWGGLKTSKNADGTLKLTIPEVLNKTTVYQIVTKTGKTSMITVKASDEAKGDKLVIDKTAVKQYMQVGAVQTLELDDEFSIQDQYGRTVDLSNGNGHYTLVADGGTKITSPVNAEDPLALDITGKIVGTETKTFTLKYDNVVVDTLNFTFTVVKDEDIVSFKSDTIDALYATDIAGYTQDAPDVFGELSNSALVALAVDTVVDRSVDNTKFNVAGTIGSDVTVKAPKLLNGVTEINGTFVTTVKVDNTISTVKTPVKALSAEPVAQSAEIKIETVGTGISVSGDTITLTEDALNKLLAGSPLVTADHGDIYFYGLDQYDKKVQPLSYMTAKNENITQAQYSVTNSGMLSKTGTSKTGDAFNITATTKNGLVKTMKFEVGNVNVATDAEKTAALAKINAGTEVIGDFAIAGINNAIEANRATATTGYDAVILADGGNQTLTEIQTIVNDVNNAATTGTGEEAALVTLNDSTTKEAMQTALVNTNLNLDISVYNQLSLLNKDLVATDLLNDLSLNDGFANKTEVQNELNSKAAIIAKAISMIDGVVLNASATAITVAQINVANTTDTPTVAIEANKVAYQVAISVAADNALNDATKIDTMVTTVNAQEVVIAEIEAVVKTTGTTTGLDQDDLNAATGLTTAIVGNVTEYKAAIVAAADGALNTKAEVVSMVAAVNEAKLVLAYTEAADVTAMQGLLDATTNELGLELEDYTALTDTDKTAVAQELLDAKDTLTTKVAIQSAVDAAVAGL